MDLHASHITPKNPPSDIHLVTCPTHITHLLHAWTTKGRMEGRLISMISVDCWLVCNTVPSNQLQHITALQKLAWSALKGMQFQLMSWRRRIQMTLSLESLQKILKLSMRRVLSAMMFSRT